MRIFVAGATGVIGRELLPMLAGHEIVGMTRSRPDVVRDLGGTPALVDVYDREAVLRAVAEARPEVVVDLLTDLAGRDFAANSRIRREGTANLVPAAVAAGARRFVVESVSFPLEGEGGAALAEMERLVRESGMVAVVLRFALLWGPGTWYEAPQPGQEFIHVREAAEQTRDAIFGRAPAAAG